MPKTPALKISTPAHEFWELEVLFEDPHLLAVHKPAGLRLHPDPAAPDSPSILGLLHAGIAANKSWTADHNLEYVDAPYRLDAELSGVALLAKSRPVMTELASQFGSGKPSWSFLALVSGQPPDEFESTGKIGPDLHHEGRMRIDPAHGKKSCTGFHVESRYKPGALVRCSPLQDRPHQVRLHLQQAGHPACGDTLYRGRILYLSSFKPDYHLKPNREEKPLTPRPAVHCEAVRFLHPDTKEEQEVICPLAKDLAVALKYLTRYAAL
jgi:23S rRNA-/tRNA-specific pseudouridylate synthase